MSQALRTTLADNRPGERERLALFVSETVEECDLSVQGELLGNEFICQLIKGNMLPEIEPNPSNVQKFVPPDFSKCISS